MDTEASTTFEDQFTPKSKKKRPKFIRIVDCQVCGDKANDHIHYGAIACYSCRAFFRRGVGASSSYQCTFGQNCDITLKTRKQCQFCRFKKCLDIGMIPTWVMTDEEKLEKKEKTVKRKIMAPVVDKNTLANELKTQYEARMREQRIQSRLERKRKMRQNAYLMSKMPSLTPLDNRMESGISSSDDFNDSCHEQRMNDFDEQDMDIDDDVEYISTKDLQEEADFAPTPMMMATEATVLHEYLGSECNEENVRLHSSALVKSGGLLSNCLELSITNEERGFVKQLWQLELETSKSIPVPHSLMKMIVAAAKTGSHIPSSAAVQGYSICMQRVIKYATQMDFFNRLHQRDRFKLLLKNVDMLVNIRTARLLRPDANLRDQLSHVVGLKRPQNGTSNAVAPPSTSSNRLRVHQFFGSPWAEDRSYEEKYEALLQDIFELQMDHMTTTLLSLMALFSESADYDLVSAKDVIAAEEYFSSLLYRYLCAEVGRANASNLLPQYKKALKKLQEMAMILAEKKLNLAGKGSRSCTPIADPDELMNVVDDVIS